MRIIIGCVLIIWYSLSTGTGHAACWSKSLIPNVTKVGGQLCKSGSICRLENVQCDISHPTARCKNVNNFGACACKCI